MKKETFFWHCSFFRIANGSTNGFVGVAGLPTSPSSVDLSETAALPLIIREKDVEYQVTTKFQMWTVQRWNQYVENILLVHQESA